MPGGLITIRGILSSQWSSPGTLRASNGGGLALEGTYTLTTPLTVGSGGRLNLSGRWTSETTITATDARIWLGGRDPWANRGTIALNNCTVVLLRSATTDNLKAERLVGATPAEVIARVDEAGLAFDPALGTGVTVHLLGAIHGYGKMGATCIAHSPDAASDLYARLVTLLANR